MSAFDPCGHWPAAQLKCPIEEEATIPIGQAPQALVYVPDAVPAVGGALNAAMTRMPVAPEGLGTSNLQPLGLAGQSAQLWLVAGLESAPDNQKRLAAFPQGLSDLGWHEGGNIRVECRWSDGKEELIRKYAEELVALRPDVILANGTPVIGEFKRINATIPIIFALAMDPVGLGNVQSLSHPLRSTAISERRQADRGSRFAATRNCSLNPISLVANP